MPLWRHGVFNIGAMGQPIEDPHFREMLAMKQFQAQQQGSAQDRADRKQSAQMKAIQGLLAAEAEERHRQEDRENALEDWNREYQAVTQPAQELERMEFMSGFQGDQRDRDLAEAEFLTGREDVAAQGSFKEREILREKTEKQEKIERTAKLLTGERAFETSEREATEQAALTLEETKGSARALQDFIKQGSKEEDAVRKASDAARDKAIGDEEKADTKGKVDAARGKDDEIDTIVEGLARGVKPDLSYLKSIQRELFVHAPHKIKWIAARLGAAFLQYKKIKDLQFDYEGKKAEHVKTRNYQLQNANADYTMWPPDAMRKAVSLFTDPRESFTEASSELDDEYKQHQQEILNLLIELDVIPGVVEYIETGAN